MGLSRWKRCGLWVLVGLWICSGCSAQSGTRTAGKLAPDQYFTLNDLNGQPVSLDKALSGRKAVLVNFWATWCPPCRAEIPDLIRLQSDYGSKGFTVMGVNLDESQAKVSSFAGKVGMNFPILLDPGGKTAERYGIVGIPTSLLILPDGTITGQYHAVTEELVSAVERVTAE